MGCIGSYLSKQQTVVYNIKNDSIAIDMITKTLNKSGYNCSNDIKDHYEGEIVYSSKTQSAGFYGKVFVTTYQDTIEVKAPRILFIKYLNKLKIERQ
jgi:hypothetical protein